MSESSSFRGTLGVLDQGFFSATVGVIRSQRAFT